MKVYSGYRKDTNKLLQSASGGVAAALSEKIIEEGGVVFGVRYTEDFHGAEYCCAETLADLEPLKGSKYTASRKGDVYAQVAQKLRAGKTVLFVGLGCDVAAALAYCERNAVPTERLYTVDILCHGPAAQGVHEAYVQDLEQRYGSRLRDFTIRYKKDGWTPFYIKAQFENGVQHLEPFNESDYGIAFYRIARPGCTRCAFKGENHRGDLCCGDFWGMTEKMPGWNPNGVSIMIVQQEKGEALLQKLGSDFDLRPADPKLVLAGNPMYSGSRQQLADFDQFQKDLSEQGLAYAVSQFPPLPEPPKPSLPRRLLDSVKRRLRG